MAEREQRWAIWLDTLARRTDPAAVEAYQRGVEDTLARLTSDEVQQAAARVLHFVDSDPPEYPCQVCPPRARVVLAAAAAALSARERRRSVFTAEDERRLALDFADGQPLATLTESQAEHLLDFVEQDMVQTDGTRELADGLRRALAEMREETER